VRRPPGQPAAGCRSLPLPAAQWLPDAAGARLQPRQRRHDDDGEDHATRFLFFGAANGIAFGMRQAASLSVLPSCVVQNVTPEVVFPTISEEELKQGETRQVESAGLSL
jgi:hypothetical protein